MPANGGRINFQVGYNVDQSSFNNVKKSLQDLQKIKIKDFSGTNKELEDIQRTAKQVEQALTKAFNVNLGSLNTQRFNSELSSAGLSIDRIYQSFSKAGAQGQVAFSRMASSVLTTNMQLKETHSLISSMGQTMANTVKWGIASSVMNTFTNSVRQAFDYVKGLDTALTNIRIVTGDSTEQMRQFAVEANNAAQSLGRSTMDYTKAALTFYQQGLDEESVRARTESVLTAQNITGAGEEMADYLTAVWNGYKVANEQAELYVDKLAAVADSSASNMSELAIAMSKVASTANMLGVPVDSLNAQIATIVATTRQAPETVGNALKTIYARINDIKTGSDDAEVSLGNYTKQMAALGVSVLDSNGNLRDTGDVIEEIGGKWQTLSREQQIYLARTMAGQRQYNNLLALFENWGKYSDLVAVSMDASGAAAEKNSRYMESLGAKMEQLGAAGERVKSALINEEDLKGLVDFGTNITNIFGSFIESIGGGRGALLAFGSLFTQLFSGTIAKEINNVVTNIQNARNNANKIKAEIQATQTFRTAQQNSQNGENENAAVQLLTRKTAEAQKYYSVMSAGEINAQKQRLAELDQAQNIKLLWEDKKNKAEQYAKIALRSSQQGIDSLDSETEAYQKLQVVMEDMQKRVEEAQQVIHGDRNQPNFVKQLQASAESLLSNTSGIDNTKIIELQQALAGVNENTTKDQAATYRLQAAINNFSNDATQKINNVNNVVEQYKNKTEQATQTSARLQKDIDENIAANKQLFDIKNIVGFVSGLGQVASGINGIVNLVKIWRNENLSTGEKILQTFTNLSMTIGMFASGLSRVRDGWKSTSELIIKAGNAINAAKMANATASTTQAAAQGVATSAKVAGTVAAEGETVANLGLAASFGTIMAAALPFIALFGGIVLAVHAAVKAWNKQADAAQQAAQVAKEAKQTYEDLKQSYEELKSSLEDYNAAQQAIESMTKGTQEWRDAIRESNDAVLELLNNYPQLAKYIENVNGQLQISKAGQQEALALGERAVSSAQLASTALAARSRDASALASAAAIGHQTWGMTSSNGRENIYGMASAEDVKAVAQALNNSRSLLKESGENIQNLNKVISDSTGVSEDLVKSIRENDKQLSKLQAELIKNEQATRLSYEAIASQNLQNIQEYKNLDDLGKQVADALGGKSLEIDVDSFLKTDQFFKQIDNRIDAFNGGQETFDNILKRFRDAMGDQTIGWQSNKVSGWNGSEFNFLIDGDKITYSKEQVASIVASYEAIQELGNSAKQATEFLNGLNSDKNNQGFAKGIQQLLAGNGFGNLTEKQLENLTSTDLSKFYEDNKSILSSFGFEEFEQFSSAISDEMDKIAMAGQRYLNNLPPLRKVFSDIVDEKNLTANAKDTIGKSLAQAFETGGQEAVNSIKNLYNSIDNISAFEELSQNLDFSTMSVEQFKDQLQKAKVAIDATDEALQTYIDLQQKSIEPLSGVESLDTLNMLGTKASGGSLDEQSQKQLSENLNRLAAEYDNLIGAVQVLNTQWLEGTMMYQRALHDVNNQLLENAEQALASEDLSSSQISKQVSSFIQDVETLQNALYKQLLTNNDYSDTLQRLASQYESCSTELDRYLLAINSGTEQTIRNAEATLQLSVRAAELEQATGISADQIERMADHLADTDPLLSKNSELAADAAARYIKLNRAIADLYDNADSYRELMAEIAESGMDAIYVNEDLFNSFSEMKDVVADLFDTSSEFLGDDWILKNMENILQVAENGGEGLRQLQELASQEIYINLGIDLNDFYDNVAMAQEDFFRAVANMDQGADLTLDLDMLAFIQQLVTAMEQAGYAQDQIENALSGMGIDVDLVPYEAGLNQAIEDAIKTGRLVSDHFAQNAGVNAKVHTETTSTPSQTVIPSQEYEVSYQTGRTIYPDFEIGSGPVPTISFNGYRDVATRVPVFLPKSNPQVVEGETQSVATGLEVIGATKSSGGKISHFNSSPARSARTGRASTKSSRGSGGGGSSSKPKAPSVEKLQKISKPTQNVTAERDPYHDINLALEKQETLLEDIQKKDKKLVNRDRLKNLQDQNKALEKQQDLLNEKSSIAATELVTLRNDLLAQLGNGIKFDANGQISNYNQALQNAANGYNKAIDAYNKQISDAENSYNNWITNVYNTASAEQQQTLKNEKDRRKEQMDAAKETAKTVLDTAKQEYDAIKNNIKEYEKTLDLQKDIAEKVKDISEQIYENLIAMSKITVDLSIDTGDAEREWLEFENKFIKKLDSDDFLGNAKANVKELMSYFNSEQVQRTAEQIANINKQITIMQNGGTSSIYGNNLAQAKEDLEQYMKQQMDDLSNVQDLVDDIKDSYLDAIDDANDKMDQQISQYERINDLIEHNVKLTELLYGDKAYDTINKYYNLRLQNNKQELDSLKRQQDYWKERMDQEVIGSDAWKKFKDNLDAVTDDLNSKLEDMIQNLADQWQNRVDGIIEKLNNALTNGRGLDYLDEQWDYINDYDDDFLDTVNARFGIQEVENLYNEAINGLMGNPAQQQKINKLMNDQLKILREKDKLTEYDVERAKAILQVEQARMALEDARNAKTKMRLRRDSQGNYTYQYVADEERLGELQQALADAQSNLYNQDKEHYKQNLNSLYDTYKNYLEKMRDLTVEYNATQDEEERKRIQGRMELLEEATNKIMSGYTEDNAYALQYLNESFFDAMGINSGLYTAEQQIELMNQNIPQMSSNIQDLANRIIGQGGILNATADAIKEINKATEEYDNNVQDILNTAGTGLENISQAVDESGNALDVNIQNAERFITANERLIEACDAQIREIQTLLNWLDQYIEKIINVETLVANLRNAYNTDQQLNGSNLTAGIIPVADMGIDTTFSSMNEYEDYLNEMRSKNISQMQNDSVLNSIQNTLGNEVLSVEKLEGLFKIIQTVQNMTKALNGFSSSQLASLGSDTIGTLNGIANSSTLDQNVHIEANFPNVTQHTEIEQAFENLVNMASMHASGYRD